MKNKYIQHGALVLSLISLEQIHLKEWNQME